MNRLEMRQKLGLSDSASGKQVDNAAIREWCEGGAALLDAMHQLHLLKESTRWVGGDAPIEASIRSLGIVRERMLDHLHDKGPA